eukprot:RCo038016
MVKQRFLPFSENAFEGRWSSPCIRRCVLFCCVRMSRPATSTKPETPEWDTEAVLNSGEIERCVRLYYACDGMNRDNLKAVFHQLGIEEADEAEIEALFTSTASKFLDIRTFLSFVQKQKNRHVATMRANTDDDLVDAFVAMGGERDHSGFVNASKLYETAKLFELTIDLERLISDLDADGSGCLDFQEFAVLFRDKQRERLRMLLMERNLRRLSQGLDSSYPPSGGGITLMASEEVSQASTPSSGAAARHTAAGGSAGTAEGRRTLAASLTVPRHRGSALSPLRGNTPASVHESSRRLPSPRQAATASSALRSATTVMQEARLEFDENRRRFPGDINRFWVPKPRRPLTRRHLGRCCTSTSTTVILPPLDYGTSPTAAALSSPSWSFASSPGRLMEGGRLHSPSPHHRQGLTARSHNGSW